MKGSAAMKARSAALALFLVCAAGSARAWTIEELDAAIAQDRARIERDHQEVAAIKARIFDDKSRIHRDGLAQDRDLLDDAENRLSRDKVQLRDHKKARKQLRKAQKAAD